MNVLSSFVEKLAQKTGRYISYASPILDGSLPDGSRVNATYTKDITSKGPTFTIRKFTKTPWTPIQLLGFHELSPEMLAYFWILMQYQSNFMIVGGTASGKTTLLNAIAFFIPPENRVVSIEDTREINLPRENWLPSVVRTGVTGTGVGTVDMFTLLRGSFRQNPDYVIVGEVRGKEASVLFQGMASGHASISTMHADSVDSLIMRLETPPINLSPMLVNGLDVVVVVSHAIVGKKETRRLREIVEIVKVEADGTATTNTPFSWNPADDKFYYKKDSRVFNKISEKFGIPLVKLQKEFEIRTKLIYALYKNKILGYDVVGKVIKEYDKSPEKVLKRFGISSA
jgi:flagellar protein FlaI